MEEKLIQICQIFCLYEKSNSSKQMRGEKTYVLIISNQTQIEIEIAFETIFVKKKYFVKCFESKK